MVQIKITQVKSQIHRPHDQKDTLKALGLGRVNRTVIKTANPALLGMVRKVSHLVRVEEV